MTEIQLSNYEITFIVRPDIQELEVDKLVTSIQNSIATRGGQILTANNWGKQRLAYPINKHEFGYYSTFVFTHPKAKIADFENEIKLMPEVIRHLIISLDKEGIRPNQLRKLNPFQDKDYAPRPTPTSPAPEAKKSDKDEATRMKELDEKLEGLLGEEEQES